MFLDLDMELMDDDLSGFENTLYMALPEVAFFFTFRFVTIN